MTAQFKEVRIIVKKQNEYSPWELGYWVAPEVLAEVETELERAKAEAEQEDSEAEAEKVEAEE